MSRNRHIFQPWDVELVTSREGRVSRNAIGQIGLAETLVTSREGRVSRNGFIIPAGAKSPRHVPRGACE